MRNLIAYWWEVLVYWRTGYVWRKCSLCNANPYKCPEGTTPGSTVKVYCMKCLEPEMAKSRKASS